MEEKPITIKKFGLSNLEALVKLVKSTFIESWKESESAADIDIYVKENFSSEMILSELKDAAIIYLVAELNTQPVGYVKLQRNCQPYSYELERPMAIHRLYVKKEQQGLKIGSTLVNEAKAIALTEKYHFLWLGVWNKNHGAMRLYERIGFKIFGNYQFIMGSSVSDDYLMKLELTNEK